MLDRLLEDERLTFDGISATSAGCVNAVLLADGLASGGRQAAKDLLKVFWKKISDLTSSSIIAPSLFDKYNPTFGLEYSPGYLFVDMVSRFISPYQLNPLDINPLRESNDAGMGRAGVTAGVLRRDHHSMPDDIKSLKSNSRSTWYPKYRCASSFHLRLKATVLVVPFGSSGTYRVGNEGKAKYIVAMAIGSFALGAAAVQTLHAAASPPDAASNSGRSTFSRHR